MATISLGNKAGMNGGSKGCSREVATLYSSARYPPSALLYFDSLFNILDSEKRKIDYVDL